MTSHKTLYSGILLALIVGVTSQTIIERGPVNVTVSQGQDALFTCRVRNKGVTEVSWFRASTGTRISIDWRVDPGRRPTFGQYLIEGDPNFGDVNLKITQVQPEDAGEYFCGFVSGMALMRSSGFLKVLRPPGDNYPHCVQPATQDLAVGDIVRLQCMSHGGSPPAKLVWLINGNEVSEGRQYTNTLDWTLGLNDLNAEFTCRAESQALPQPRSCTTSIQLQDPVITIQPLVGKVEVGETVTFLCVRQDKPSENRFNWFYRGRLVTPYPGSRFNISDYNRALTISNIVEEDGNAAVKCSVPVLSNLQYSAQGAILVSIMTGEVRGTLPPPGSRTNVPSRLGTESRSRKGDQAVSTIGFRASEEGKPSRDSTALFVVLGAGGGLLVVVAAVVIHFVFSRRHKNGGKTEQKPEPKSTVRHTASGVSLTTKNSDRSLSSSDSVVTAKTVMTTAASRKDVNSTGSDASKHTGNHYAELDSKGLRTSEYQGLHSPPNNPQTDTIYAEPIILPTSNELVTRVQHDDDFHDYALPDILPETDLEHEHVPDDYVEPDPPPRDNKAKEEDEKPKEEDKQAETKKEDKTKPSQKNEDAHPKHSESVYIEIIA